MTYKELQAKAKRLNEDGADIKVFGVNSATLKQSIEAFAGNTTPPPDKQNDIAIVFEESAPVPQEAFDNLPQTIEDLQQQRDDLASSDKKALEIAQKLGATIILAEKNGITLRKGDVEAYVRTDQPDEDIYKTFNGMGIV